MKKNVIIVVQFITILFLVGLLIWPNIPKKQTQETNEVDSSQLNSQYKDASITFEFIVAESNTWGYRILIEGSPVIIQPNKPGLPGNEGFKTQQQAEKVAKLVISKIRNGEMPPTVTIDELKGLGVL
ncbi:MAG: DUF4907 domain-containing protein [Tenuifilaceae bacterium]|jgi:hypothetical protein|nr:DUF4907 domain-containing protein [Tenuifilaceae bacterium]